MKLFAVVLLAGASQAQAEAPEARRSENQDKLDAARHVSWNAKIDIMAIKPRRLENGRPAPGNSMSKPLPRSAKQERAILTTRAELAYASLAYQAANAITPPPLGKVRLACSDVEDTRPADCTAAELHAARVIGQAHQQRNAIVQAAHTKLLAATLAAVRAEPALQARLLVNGRPACGNTMAKQRQAEYCRITASTK
ncbi:MAG TPA: hypothetical protein VIV11_16465 [Kofleriaceae bacterium]